MRTTLLAVLLVLACGGKDAAPAAAAGGTKAVPAADSPFKPNDIVLDHAVTTIEGKPANLADYRGKAVLLVNTASQCGFTPQYAGLQELYGEMKGRGLEVLAFPSDDFGNQEPGTPEEIKNFVASKFAVEFPMFDKVHATGPEISPLYKTLTEQTGDGIRGEVKWNFTKFLVDPKGRVVARFEPGVEPGDPKLRAAIEAALPAG
jgi:glutathione peroxidase